MKRRTTEVTDNQSLFACGADIVVDPLRYSRVVTSDTAGVGESGSDRDSRESGLMSVVVVSQRVCFDSLLHLRFDLPDRR